jgi:hypothetical protein
MNDVEALVDRAKKLVTNMRKTFPNRGPTSDIIDELCATITRLMKERDEQTNATIDAVQRALREHIRAEAAEQALAAREEELRKVREENGWLQTENARLFKRLQKARSRGPLIGSAALQQERTDNG